MCTEENNEQAESEAIMVHNAHFSVEGSRIPTIKVRDDRGAAITELELPSNTITDPDAELRDAGWSRSADWSTTSDGWVAPVAPV